MIAQPCYCRSCALDHAQHAVCACVRVCFCAGVRTDVCDVHSCEYEHGCIHPCMRATPLCPSVSDSFRPPHDAVCPFSTMSLGHSVLSAPSAVMSLKRVMSWADMLAIVTTSHRVVNFANRRALQRDQAQVWLNGAPASVCPESGRWLTDCT